MGQGTDTISKTNPFLISISVSVLGLASLLLFMPSQIMDHIWLVKVQGPGRSPNKNRVSVLQIHYVYTKDIIDIIRILYIQNILRVTYIRNIVYIKDCTYITDKIYYICYLLYLLCSIQILHVYYLYILYFLLVEVFSLYKYNVLVIHIADSVHIFYK